MIKLNVDNIVSIKDNNIYMSDGTHCNTDDGDFLELIYNRFDYNLELKRIKDNAIIFSCVMIPFLMLLMLIKM